MRDSLLAEPDNARPSSVWLLGGASGSGKTRVAYRLAGALGVPVVEVDDIVEALLAMSTPDQQPTLHYWRTHPDAARLPAEDIVNLQVAVAVALLPALRAVITNHLETATPVLIEGDYLLPVLAEASSRAGRVRAVFLAEADERQLVANLREREPQLAAQAGRAHVSRLYGEWLAAEARRARVPVVAARPWSTVVQRVLEALGA